MSDKITGSVNVDEGFLPNFAQGFIERYGRDSLFVRTLSDYFTGGLVRMLEAHDTLNSPDTVAWFSNPRAVQALTEWIASVDGAKLVAFQEAMGVQPVGALETLVDARFTPGRFQEWLVWLEEFGDR